MTILRWIFFAGAVLGAWALLLLPVVGHLPGP